MSYLKPAIINILMRKNASATSLANDFGDVPLDSVQAALGELEREGAIILKGVRRGRKIYAYNSGQRSQICVVCSLPAQELGFHTVRAYCSVSCYRSVVADNKSVLRHEERVDFITQRRQKMKVTNYWIGMYELAKSAKTLRQFYASPPHSPDYWRLWNSQWTSPDILIQYSYYVTVFFRRQIDQPTVLKAILDCQTRHYSHDVTVVNLLKFLPQQFVSEFDLFVEIYLQTLQIYEYSLGFVSGKTSQGRWALARSRELNPTPSLIL